MGSSGGGGSVAAVPGDGGHVVELVHSRRELGVHGDGKGGRGAPPVGQGVDSMMQVAPAPRSGRRGQTEELRRSRRRCDPVRSRMAGKQDHHRKSLARSPVVGYYKS